MAPLPQVFLSDDDFTPARFQNTHSIIQMHNVPRVTTQREVSVLVTGASEDKMEYLMGLYVYAICTFSVFAIWAILIFVFKCCGTKRVGFLSGRTRLVPPSDYECDAVRVFELELKLEEEIPPLPVDGVIAMSGVCDTPAEMEATSDNVIVEDDDNGGTIRTGLPLNADERRDNHIRLREGTDRLLFWTRIIAIASGVVAVVSSSVFVNEGVFKLAATLDAGIVGMQHVNGILLDGIDIINTYQERRFSAFNALADLNSTVLTVDWCPLRREEFIESCGAITAANSTTAGPINETACEIMGVPLQGALATLLMVYRIVSTAFETMDVIKSDLQQIVNLLDWIIPQANSFYWAFYVSAAFAVTVDVIILVLLFGVYLAWRKRRNTPFSCARSYFIIPLFVLCVFLMWLFAIIFCFTAILTADFCYNGPDTRLVNTLMAFRHVLSPHAFELLKYYLTGCPEPGFSILEPQTAVAIVEGVTLVHDVIDDLSQLDASIFLEICEVKISPLALLMESVHDEMHVIADSLGEVQQLFLCRNIFPVLEIFMYDAVCYLGVDAFRNIFVALLLTMGFSLMFITVRVAWQEEVHHPDAENMKEVCPSFRGCSRRRSGNAAVDDAEDSIAEHNDDRRKANMEAAVIPHDETSNSGIEEHRSESQVALRSM